MALYPSRRRPVGIEPRASGALMSLALAANELLAMVAGDVIAEALRAGEGVETKASHMTQADQKGRMGRRNAADHFQKG